MDRLSICCPGANVSKDERIRGLLDSCFDWIYSDPFRSLVALFDGQELLDSLSGDRTKDIELFHKFVRCWDFRNGKERWTVDDGQFVVENAAFIMEQAKMLGLVGVVTPQNEPDYILPLGGARRSNLVRPLMAKKVYDDYQYREKTIVALSGTRPIADAERPYVDEYAPSAVTEYDAISAGLEKAFNVKEYTEEIDYNENINLCSAVRKYKDMYEGSNVFSLAAPSPDPNRRANSYDTFEFLLKHFNIGQGDRLLLVTSCIYVPFQYLKFMKLAIDGGFEVDCIGSDIVDNVAMSKPSNYLQEIKGTVDAIYGLFHEFCDNEDNKKVGLQQFSRDVDGCINGFSLIPEDIVRTYVKDEKQEFQLPEDSFFGRNEIRRIEDFEFYRYLCEHPELKSIKIPKNAESWSSHDLVASNVLNIMITPSLKYLGSVFWRSRQFEENLGGRIYYTGTEEQWSELLSSCPGRGLTDYTPYRCIVRFVEEESFQLPEIDYHIILNDNNEYVREQIRYCTHSGNVTIPTSYTDDKGVNHSISAIGMLSFAYNDGLEKVIIPPQIEVICMDAFRGCKNLREVIICEGNTDVIIEPGAFCECDSLEHVQIARNAIIDQYAFAKVNGKKIKVESIQDLNDKNFVHSTAFQYGTKK